MTQRELRAITEPMRPNFSMSRMSPELRSTFETNRLTPTSPSSPVRNRYGVISYCHLLVSFTCADAGALHAISATMPLATHATALLDSLIAFLSHEILREGPLR